MSTGLKKYFETGGKKLFSFAVWSLALLTVIMAVALMVVQIVGFKGFKPYDQMWKCGFGVFGFMVFAFLLISVINMDHGIVIGLWIWGSWECARFGVHRCMGDCALESLPNYPALRHLLFSTRLCYRLHQVQDT